MDLPGTKVGLSEPLSPLGEGQSCQKSYPGDNRLVPGESTHRPRRLEPRCRLFPSWLCRSSQGCGCSPVKGNRELGSIRRETVWLLTGGFRSGSERKWTQVREERVDVANGERLSDKACRAAAP